MHLSTTSSTQIIRLFFQSEVVDRNYFKYFVFVTLVSCSSVLILFTRVQDNILEFIHQAQATFLSFNCQSLGAHCLEHTEAVTHNFLEIWMVEEMKRKSPSPVVDLNTNGKMTSH